MVNALAHSDIGYVTGSGVILNVNENVGKIENQYQKLLNYKRSGETIIDSTFQTQGEAVAFKKRAIEDLTSCSGSFDIEAALTSRKNGFRSVYNPKVKFYEFAPTFYRERTEQKIIRGTNLVRAIWKYRGMMFRKRYGKFGFIIFPFNFALFICVPILILHAGFWTFFELIIKVNHIIQTFYTYPLLLLLIIIVMFMLRGILLSFIQSEYALLIAISRLFFSRGEKFDKINKISSTRADKGT